jgi:hypothetical protein
MPFCPKCRTKIEMGDTYCMNCGYNIQDRIATERKKKKLTYIQKKGSPALDALREQFPDNIDHFTVLFERSMETFDRQEYYQGLIDWESAKNSEEARRRNGRNHFYFSFMADFLIGSGDQFVKFEKYTLAMTFYVEAFRILWVLPKHGLSHDIFHTEKVTRISSIQDKIRSIREAYQNERSQKSKSYK